MLIKFIVIFMLLLILGSLGSALVFLLKDSGQSNRTVKALTVRISLSVTLFILLMAGYYFGIIPPQGIGR
jgi:small neutral amino acid transporter SnatA (MarC family)